MRKMNLSPAAAAMASLLISVAAPLNAPLHAQEKTGSIHGHVQTPVGIPMSDGMIGLASEGDAAGFKNPKYSFKTDTNGDYKGDGIAPGTYTIFLRQPDTPADKVVDQFPEVKITAGGDTLQDFDLTRPAYMATLSPEQRKLVEETRAKNASALKENSVIKNLNANLAKAREDDKNKNYAEADQLMTQATQAKPDAAILWFELGVAQNGEAKYDDASTSFKKAIDLDAASKKPSPELQGEAGSALGEALARQKKIPEAEAAFDAAAKINPAGAGKYYQNEAILMYQTVKDMPATLDASNKAIAADPTRAIPYYFKGQALVQNATVDKAGKIVLPPGCLEAYQKYLELAPDGQLAPEVKQMLESMGQTIKSSYKAKK
jgi:tetratricopeptide (TPR) repeat protein